MSNVFYILFFFLALININAQDLSGYDDLCSKYIKETIPIVTIDELDSLMQNEKIILFDAREKKEYEVSHIPGAILVGYNNYPMTPISNINKNSKIVVYCSIGYRSEKNGEKLKEAGYQNVFNLYGGIFSWGNNKKGIVTKNNNKTKNIHGYNKEWSKWINTKNNRIIIN